MDYTLEINGNTVSLRFSESLITNRQYTVTVKPGIEGIINDSTVTLSDEFEFWFTSTFCPLFTSLTQVKMAMGPIAADYFIDDTIYRMIHKNSLDAIDIYNANNRTKIPYDYWGCTWHDVPYVLRKYVECKTAYDILSLIQATLDGGTGGGSVTKKLRDMSISYGSGGNSGASLDPNQKKQLYDCWIEMLRGIKSIKTAVRGYYDNSKGYSHPVREPEHNRIIRAVDFRNASPSGPWEQGRWWRGFK